MHLQWRGLLAPEVRARIYKCLVVWWYSIYPCTSPCSILPNSLSLPYHVPYFVLYPYPNALYTRWRHPKQFFKIQFLEFSRAHDNNYLTLYLYLNLIPISKNRVTSRILHVIFLAYIQRTISCSSSARHPIVPAQCTVFYIELRPVTPAHYINFVVVAVICSAWVLSEPKRF